MMNENTQKLIGFLEDLVAKQSLLKGTLSDPRDKTLASKVTIRPIVLKNKTFYQCTYQYPQKVVHKNIEPLQFEKACLQMLTDYKKAFFSTLSEDFHLLINKKGHATILSKPSSKKTQTNFLHNRPKNYILKESHPIPFLVELGVMSSTGNIYADKRSKFRQINRFLEMVEDVLSYLPKDKTLRIVDFGCGKSYLSFALYHFLHEEKKYEVEMIGLDLKEDVISFCQGVTEKLKFNGLHFQLGDIGSYSTDQPIDLVITLHACDTATDAALEKAIRWNAKVILAVPCCQHELFKQIRCESLNPILSHGILKERFAALATDAVRVQFLEMMGYKTQILEFIDMEHTPKNLLIRAVYHGIKPNQNELLEKYKDFQNLLKITPSIEIMLKTELEN